MSGRLSHDSNGQAWNYASVPSGANYAPDGSLNSAGHGRRSSIYRAQNSTLFSAFEEGENLALSDLPEEDEGSDGETRGDQRDHAQGRSLIGKTHSAR